MSRRFRRPTQCWALGVFLALVVAGPTSLGIVAQTINLDEVNAQEEFRFGVQAYHAARFNDAIVGFTRALAFTPEDVMIREWLGRAYFRAGLEDAAQGEWNLVVEAGGAGAYLLSRLETLRYRRGIMPFADGPLSLARSQVLRGLRDGTRIFQRPAGGSAGRGGEIYLVSLGTQEILEITPNGRINRRLGGGLEGLDKPFDAVRRGDDMVVSEFGADRIAVLNRNGNKTQTFGSSGLGYGELLGPQYLAVDSDGAVYVSEWGNRRVSKFGFDGRFLLTLGSPSPFFNGLQRPTGVAARDGLVYVADSDSQGVALHVFDGSGNHLRRIDLPLSGDDASAASISGAVVEDLSWYDREHLLITTGRRVLVFNPDNEEVVTEIDDGERQRVTGAFRDSNGRVIVTDFDADEVGIFEPEGSLYAGLDVEIERIVTREFPQVALQVSVHDRDGAPLVGLTADNFVVAEEGFPRPDARLAVAGMLSEAVDMVVLVQPRVSELYREDAAQALRDLAGLRGGDDTLSLFLAGQEVQQLLDGPATAERYGETVAGALSETGDLFQRDLVRLDHGLRRAASTLLNRGLRRNLVVVGDGRVGDSAFGEYGIEEIAAFLRNNGIRLHLVTLEQRSPAAELAYLVEQTGGRLRYLYEPEGLAPLVAELRGLPNGQYWLQFQSRQDPDFGREYIDVSVEARLFVRSGRDELGFFGIAEQ